MSQVQTLTCQWAQLWTPPERLPLSEWAEKHFNLSTEFATRNGPIKLFGWQREIFDAFTDPRTMEISAMLAIQLVKTLLIQCALAYIIAEDPGPVLLVEPKEKDAETFSKKRLKPMLECCPILRNVMLKDTSKDNTVLSKDFPGGNFTAVSALVPGNLAGRTIRYLLCDEIDKYDVSAGKAGDPIALAKGRTTNFGSLRKIVQTCSPTNEGESRIALAYDVSDKRKPWVPCPHCNAFQVLTFDRVKWGEKLPEHLRGDDPLDLPGPVHYECESCGGYWDDLQRRKACELTKWIAEKPFKGHAGFWISHLYSPWNSLHDLASDFLVAKRNKQTLKVFVTERLAELWKEDGTVPDEQMLYERRESYPFGDEAIVPMGGLFLTAAVDVQESPPRLEVEVVAWGRDKESWSIDYRVIQAQANDQAKTLLPVTSPELWTQLSTLLQRDYRHESGARMPIWLMAIDTGTRPQPVYAFALRHPQPAYNIAGGISVISPRSVVPVKGDDEDLQILSTVSKENAARKRQNVRIVSIGTHACKTELFDNLRHVKPDPDGKPVANCLHFPKYERSYFEGLCSERRVVTNTGDVKWQKVTARNEPLDLKVYNRGAATIFGIDRFKAHQWAELERRLKPPLRVVDSEPASSQPTPKPVTTQRQPQVRRPPMRFKI
jgi:phage terminase large subunit GpA-like protein